MSEVRPCLTDLPQTYCHSNESWTLLDQGCCTVLAGRNAVNGGRADAVPTDPFMMLIAPTSGHDHAAAFATGSFCEIQNNVQVRALGSSCAVSQIYHKTKVTQFPLVHRVVKSVVARTQMLCRNFVTL